MLCCDNHGRFEGDDYVIWKACTKSLGWDLQQTMSALASLFSVQLVHGFIDDGSEYVHIVNFDEHQPQRFIGSRGKPRSPQPPCEKGGVCSGFVDTGGDTGDNEARAVAVQNIELEGEVELEDRANALVGDDVADVPDEKAKRYADPVWLHWLVVAAEIQVADVSRVKPTDERWRRLNARRADGYSDAELIECIDGFVADPHHRGVNEQRTPYLDWPTIFKSSSKVDDGIRRARRGGAIVSVGTEQGRPSRVRPQ